MYLDLMVVLAHYSDPNDALLDEIHSIRRIALLNYLLAIGIMLRYEGVRQIHAFVRLKEDYVSVSPRLDRSKRTKEKNGIIVT
jgi:hypothetical protein